MVKAVVGANWGDEGKGKITDMLAQEADIIVRFQGGANAGHTIVNDYGKFALHTLPSGVFYRPYNKCNRKRCCTEHSGILQRVQRSSFKRCSDAEDHDLRQSTDGNVLITFCLMQYEEERLGGKSFGSTKSGIAPFYSDKYAKIGFQVSELFDDEAIEEKKLCVLQSKERTS